MNIRNMEIIRTIHPVGQGGFYTETLESDSDKHTVVYDCGGSSKKSMEEYLKKYLHKDSSGNRMEIDAVFISHLHADHINGLEYLLNNANVHLLILPQLTEEMKWEALVFNYCHHADGRAVNQFILGLYGDNGRNYDTRIVHVNPAEPESQINIEGDSRRLIVDSFLNLTAIHSGTQLYSEDSWMYIPYNPPVKSHGKDLYTEIKVGLGLLHDFTFSELPSILKNKKTVEQCRSIYESCFGKNHNSYSMTLFSGTWAPEYYSIRPSRRRYLPYKYRIHSPNCLYTGDFEPNPFIGDLIHFYQPLWKTIQSIQVPHHGSRENYHPSLYEFAERGFISVGETNRYHHPNPNIDTLIHIHDEGCYPVVVTENLNTMRMFHYLD